MKQELEVLRDGSLSEEEKIDALVDMGLNLEDIFDLAIQEE